MRTLLALLLLAVNASAVIIPSNRQTPWFGYTGVKNGIPDSSTMTTFTTISAGASLATVNSALSSCPSNQVVRMASGSYSFSDYINFKTRKGVILKGAGPGSTVISITGSSTYGSVMFSASGLIDPNSGMGIPSSNIHNWTSGYSQGTTSITVDSTTGMSVGMLLCLDQLNDGIDVSGIGSEGNCNNCSRGNGIRAQMEFVRVTSISGTTIGIDPPLRNVNWDSGLTPQVYWAWDNSSLVEMCGIEDMTLDFTANTGTIWGIDFEAAWNCWVKNLKTIKANQAHMHTFFGGNIEWRHNFLFGTQNAASQSYGMLPYYASGVWAEDNIGQEIVGIFVLGSGTSGCVASFNYSTNVLYGVSANWQIATLAPHDAHNSMNLMEGNHADAVGMDDIHGSSGYNTIFRNRLHGKEATRIQNTFAIFIQATNLYANIVGNLLGTAGYHNTYENSGTTYPSDTTIYNLGHTATSGTGLDPRVKSTIIRHGNWDVVNGGIVWDGTISDQNIPSSLIYPNGMPSWWGGGLLPWPAFDPARSTAKDLDCTNINAGFRFEFGVDPPTGGGGGSSTGTIPGRKRGGRGAPGGFFR